MTARTATRIIVVAVTVGTLAIITAGLFHPARPGSLPSLQGSPPGTGYRVGEAAPNFTLTTLDGKKTSLSNYRGKIVLINFWQTDCVSCLEEMPGLQQVYAQQPVGLHNFVVLGVELLNDPGGAQRIVREKDITYPVMEDKGQAVEGLYNVGGTPTSFLLDQQGIIRWTSVGPVSEEVLRAELKQISSEG